MEELLKGISNLVSEGLGVDFSQILVQLLAILLLFIVIRIKLWAPITKILEDRQAHIEAELEQANLIKQEASKEQAHVQQELESSKQEAREIVKNAKTLADKEAEQIVNTAKEKAEQEIKNAQIVIEQNTEKARQDIKEELVDLSFALASKIIEREVDKKDNEKVVEDFLKGVDNNAS